MINIKLHLHIGMGKTGTSSIQDALHESEDKGELAEQGVRYLGRNFRFIGEKFAGPPHDVQQHFQRSQDVARSLGERAAEQLLQINQNCAVSRFVFSNEELSLYADTAGAFVGGLIAGGVEVQVVLFVREPREWLVSAYRQWAVSHKAYEGPIQSFADSAPNLIGYYDKALEWVDAYPDRVSVHRFEGAANVVETFANIVGVRLSTTDFRSHTSPDDAELILRALFNDRFEDPILPRIFDRNTALPQANRARLATGLEEALFVYDQADAIIDTRRATIDRLMRLTAEPDTLGKPLERRVMAREDRRDLMIDYLAWMVLHGARRITHLENELTKLKGAP